MTRASILQFQERLSDQYSISLPEYGVLEVTHHHYIIYDINTTYNINIIYIIFILYYINISHYQSMECLRSLLIIIDTKLEMKKNPWNETTFIIFYFLHHVLAIRSPLPSGASLLPSRGPSRGNLFRERCHSTWSQWWLLSVITIPHLCLFYTTAEGKDLDSSSPTHPPTKICLQPFWMKLIR